jgi:hypothetical protein
MFNSNKAMVDVHAQELRQTAAMITMIMAGNVIQTVVSQPVLQSSSSPIALCRALAAT